MFTYVTKQLQKATKSILGVFQHAGKKKRLHDGEKIHDAPKPGSAMDVGPATVRMELAGRDVPVKPRALSNLDYSEDREVKGFLDQFEKHHLMLDEMKPAEKAVER